MRRLMMASVGGFVLGLWGGAFSGHAQILPVTFHGGGTTSFDGWSSLTRATLFGYPGFPGSPTWPAAIGSSDAGSQDAELRLLAGAVGGGGPFPSEESLYFGSYSQATNVLGGTLEVREMSPVAGLRSVLFQIQIGEALGYDFFVPSGIPVLKINNSTNRIAPTYQPRLLASFSNGVFFSEVSQTNEPIYVNTWAYQWNLTNTVTSFQIEFSAVTHSQVYALRLDQTSVLQNYQVLVGTPPSTNSLPPPALQLTSRGTPFFNGSQTTLSNTFRSDTNRSLQIEYTTNPTSTNWQVASPVTTGTNGTFTVALTNSGDVRTAWSQRMFFRARNTP